MRISFGVNWGEPWNPPAIFNTLLHHKDILVKIHVYNADVHERCDPSEDVFFGSLSNFTALKDLRIRVTNLLDWDRQEKVPRKDLFSVLPASLVSLTIENFDECPSLIDMVEQIEDIMRHRKGNFSLLESLEICGCFLDLLGPEEDDGMRPGFKPAMALLSIACESSGVDFAVRESEPF